MEAGFKPSHPEHRARFSDHHQAGLTKGLRLGKVPGAGIWAYISQGWSNLGHPQVIRFGESAAYCSNSTKVWAQTGLQFSLYNWGLEITKHKSTHISRRRGDSILGILLFHCAHLMENLALRTFLLFFKGQFKSQQLRGILQNPLRIGSENWKAEQDTESQALESVGLDLHPGSIMYFLWSPDYPPLRDSGPSPVKRG